MGIEIVLLLLISLIIVLSMYELNRRILWIEMELQLLGNQLSGSKSDGDNKYL